MRALVPELGESLGLVVGFQTTFATHYQTRLYMKVTGGDQSATVSPPGVRLHT